MARLTKRELKKILKECLIEILTEEPKVIKSLQESLAGHAAPAPTFNANVPQPTQPNVDPRLLAQQMVGRAAVDAPMPQQHHQQPQVNQALLEKANHLGNSFGVLGEDKAKLYQNIFADTAMNTLQNMQAAEQGQATPQQAAQDKSQLENLSHDGDIKRWASVAFAGNKK